jgi:hypothetical protein
VTGAADEVAAGVGEVPATACARATDGLSDVAVSAAAEAAAARSNRSIASTAAAAASDHLIDPAVVPPTSVRMRHPTPRYLRRTILVSVGRWPDASSAAKRTTSAPPPERVSDPAGSRSLTWLYGWGICVSVKWAVVIRRKWRP